MQEQRMQDLQNHQTRRHLQVTQTFRVRAAFTCKTRNLVCVIQCRNCGLQYVYKTKDPLHIWMNCHQSDIQKKLVASHFNQPDHSLEDLEVMAIEKIHLGDTTRRRDRESYWIFELATQVPSGINIDDWAHGNQRHQPWQPALQHSWTCYLKSRTE